ncbi:ROK family protein [Clostridium sp.]|uniref:ROK family protein n=1 Tax=Clostridium sp. TaxID=1506 RepID=UPI002FC8D938
MRLYVALDIGGTNIKYGLINEYGNIIKNGIRPTEAYKGGVGIMDKVKEIIKYYNEQYIISGICVSTAGMVCSEEGKIIYAGSTIPNYTGTEIKKILEDEFDVTCEVENDVNCAALGEFWLGVGAMKQSIVCITVGTGIGGAVVLDGKIHHGFSNSAGEIGYTIVNGFQIQDIASTTALVNSVSRRKGILSSEIDGKCIFDEYEKGDIICIEELEKLINNLCIGISNIAYLLNPEVIVLGGGIMARRDIIAPLVDKALNKYIIKSVRENTKIEFAKLENSAGMIGALYNFLQRHNVNNE